MKKLKIIVVDDHTIVRKGIAQIIADSPDMEVPDEADSGEELLAKVHKHQYDAVLLDIAMPGRDGLEILKQLKTDKIGVPVIILSIYPEEQYALRALKAGASGYLTKHTAPEELIEAIKKVTNGGKYITPSIAEQMADLFDKDISKQGHELLSDREYQILCKIASGRTVSQIAEELALSVKTVSTYRRRILEKMDMENNSELTYYAMKNNLIG